MTMPAACGLAVPTYVRIRTRHHTRQRVVRGSLKPRHPSSRQGGVRGGLVRGRPMGHVSGCRRVRRPHGLSFDSSLISGAGRVLGAARTKSSDGAARGVRDRACVSNGRSNWSRVQLRSCYSALALILQRLAPAAGRPPDRPHQCQSLWWFHAERTKVRTTKPPPNHDA